MYHYPNHFSIVIWRLACLECLISVHPIRFFLPFIKHECSTCQKIFSTKDTLGRHIKSVHLKLKRSDLSLKHDCLQCPRSFRDKRDLNVHVASVHEGIRIHCEHCQSHFNALKSYKRHLARKHGFSDEWSKNTEFNYIVRASSST